MTNKYLEKIAMNRVTRFAFDKTKPFLKAIIDPAVAAGQSPKRAIDAFKGAAKDSARKEMAKYVPTGKLPR